MLSSMLIALLPFVPAQAPSSAAPTAAETSVPAGREPKLDGVVEEGEWADAVTLASSGKGTDAEVVLLAKHAGGKLYLAVQAKHAGIASLGVADDATIHVLHASASLGSAQYRLAEGAWKRSTAFEWRCRKTDDSEEARAERREHLEKQGWLATTMKMGKGQAEFALAAPFLKSSPDGATVKLALSLFGGTAFSAPSDLKDGLRDMSLQMGTAPDELRFAPEQWLTLRLTPEPKPADAPKK